jgi:hypothetical protein
MLDNATAFCKATILDGLDGAGSKTPRRTQTGPAQGPPSPICMTPIDQGPKVRGPGGVRPAGAIRPKSTWSSASGNLLFQLFRHAEMLL